MWETEVEDGLLYNFNIDNYPEFDSAIFVAQFFRNSTNNIDTAWLRLYDYTSMSGINGSELYSLIPNVPPDDPDLRVFKSEDFYNSLLPGYRTIGIQFKSDNPLSISIHSAEIILYKNN